MQFPVIKFCSQFITDTVAGNKVYKRGEKPLSEAAGKGESLIIRVEDTLLDVSSGLYEAFKATGGSGFADSASYNNLIRIQNKDARDVAKLFGGSANLSVPVFHPVYSWLTQLSKLEYPVILLCDSRELIRFHPVFQLLGFNAVSSEELYQQSYDANLISPYSSDNPDMLFPRSFNEKSMDSLFTLNLKGMTD